MNTLPSALLLAGLLALAACGDKPGAPPATDAAAKAHAHDAGGEKITHFTDRTELFVEFPPLVVGEDATFAAHLTTLGDFKALAHGRVSVRLSGGGEPDEVFSVDSASEPGIFRPVVKPVHAGERELSIEVAAPGFSVTHELGPVTVYPDRKAAEAAPPAADEGGIVFTKEQQWKVDFATTEAMTRPVRASVAATGVLRASPDGEALLTAPAPGQVQAAGTFPRLGQVVRKGQLLAYLVPRLGGETDLATLRAAAETARVEHDLAQQERVRTEALYHEEVLPEKRLLAAQAAEAAARAALRAAQQRLGQYGGAGGGIPLRAPVAGTLAEVPVSPGTFAQEGALLFHIADRSKLWLELRVPESEAARLAAPTGAAFRVAGMERSIEIVLGKNGRLVAVGGVVDAATRTVPVVFEFSASDVRLPIGMAVQAQVFAGEAREVVAIPASSVLDEAGVNVVFVMTGGESFERRQVRLGAREGDWVEVIDGVEPGQRVVSRGAYLVKLASTGIAQIGHGHAH